MEQNRIGTRPLPLPGKPELCSCGYEDGCRVNDYRIPVTCKMGIVQKSLNPLSEE